MQTCPLAWRIGMRMVGERTLARSVARLCGSDLRLTARDGRPAPREALHTQPLEGQGQGFGAGETVGRVRRRPWWTGNGPESLFRRPQDAPRPRRRNAGGCPDLQRAGRARRAGRRPVPLDMLRCQLDARCRDRMIFVRNGELVCKACCTGSGGVSTVRSLTPPPMHADEEASRGRVAAR